MLTVKQIAAKWGISAPRVHQFLREGRIPDARKMGRDWFFPEATPFPAYRRVWVRPTSHETASLPEPQLPPQ